MRGRDALFSIRPATKEKPYAPIFHIFERQK